MTSSLFFALSVQSPLFPSPKMMLDVAPPGVGRNAGMPLATAGNEGGRGLDLVIVQEKIHRLGEILVESREGAYPVQSSAER